MGNRERDFHYIMLPAQDEKGSHILSIIAKRTYDIIPGERCVPSSVQQPLVPGDVFFGNGDPLTTSCEWESDYIPFKLSTDVVLNGCVHAPDNVPVQQLPVRIQIGDAVKNIRATGNRRCIHRMFLDPVFTEPEPFTSLELRYENAYGGTDVKSHEGRILMYPRNPIGKGFVLKKKKSCIEGMELPNLEDPEDMLMPEGLIVDRMKYWQEFPVPQSLGWYGKAWFPRAAYAGVMPADTPVYDEIREAYMGYVPEKFIESFKKLKMRTMDFRFFNGASPGLSLPFLQGNEVVGLLHLDPDFPDFTFRLPGEKPAISIDTGNGPVDTEAVLQTVMILKEQNRVCLTWRGAFPYEGPEQFKYFTDFTVNVE